MGSNLAGASQVDVALVSQDGEPTVEESVATDGNELIEDLIYMLYVSCLSSSTTCCLLCGLRY